MSSGDQNPGALGPRGFATAMTEQFARKLPRIFVRLYLQSWGCLLPRREHQRGFTLVELAIVMCVIGLLIGGILKGQELMMNARITATIAQVKSYSAAKTLFEDTYAAIPGDFKGAATRLPGCTALCDAGASAGNGILGFPPSSSWGFVQNYPPSAAASPFKEVTLFWLHMLQADLISGVSSESLTATTVSWGITHPAARIGGGFAAMHAGGNVTPTGAVPSPTLPNGVVLVLLNGLISGMSGVQGAQPLSASRAAVIDRKMDDGRPSSGSVQAYGYVQSCFTSASLQVYNEPRTGNDCGLIFEID